MLHAVQTRAASRSNDDALHAFGSKVGEALRDGVRSATAAASTNFAAATPRADEAEARAVHDAAVASFARALGAAMKAAVPPLATESAAVFRTAFRARTVRDCRRRLAALDAGSGGAAAARADEVAEAEAVEGSGGALSTAAPALGAMLTLLLRAASADVDAGAARGIGNSSSESESESGSGSDGGGASSSDSGSSGSDSPTAAVARARLARHRDTRRQHAHARGAAAAVVVEAANAALATERAAEREAEVLAREMELLRGRAAERRVAQLELELGVARADAAAEQTTLARRLGALESALAASRAANGAQIELDTKLAEQAKELRFECVQQPRPRGRATPATTATATRLPPSLPAFLRSTHSVVRAHHSPHSLDRRYDVEKQSLGARHSALRAKHRRRHEKAKAKLVSRTERAIELANAKLRKAQAHFVDSLSVLQVSLHYLLPLHFVRILLTV